MRGGEWWAMGIGWFVFLLVVVILVVVLVRHYRPATASRRSALDILDERFARGEIDDEDYRRRRDALRSG